MRLQFVFALAAMLIGSPGAFAQRQWIVYPSEYTGSGWFDMPSGNYDVNDPANPSRPYRWATGFDGERRAYWDITAENAIPIGHSDPFPAKPAFYQIEHWVPTENPVGVTWGGYTTVEVSFSGQPGEDEEGKINPFIPWNGRYRTNHQWLELVFSCGTCNGGGAEPARWRQAGPGPHAPAAPTCDAPENSPDSRFVYLRRGSRLFIKFNFDWGWEMYVPMTAVRITELVPVPRTCDAATQGGPVDLRCVGNADPIYGSGELFANSPHRSEPEVTVDGDWALAVEGYTVPLCPFPEFNTDPENRPSYPYNVALTQGLPPTGDYTARLPDGNVNFKLRFDGHNSIKWRSNSTGDFDGNKVYTLNEVAEREFLPGHYGKISLLTACSGGRGHKLNVQAHYEDGTSEVVPVNLYDWFDQVGDAVSVGLDKDGYPIGPNSTGFKLLSKYGESVEHVRGGGTSGAFLFAHTVPVNPAKTLTQISFSLESPYAPPVVIESRAGGQSHMNFSTTGGWNQDSAKSDNNEVTAGIGSLWAGSGQAGTTATFSFTPVVTAYYDVFATWAKSLDACTETAFIVTHDGGSTTVFRNQREDGNGWRHLGQYPMTAGVTYTVTIDSAQSTGGPRIYADAVRFTVPGITANLLAVTLATGVACNVPWADADGDGDVDAADFGAFQRCLTLTGAPILPGCECMDINHDSTIDWTDLNSFSECALGPDVKYVHDANPPHWPNWPALCPGMPAE